MVEVGIKERLQLDEIYSILRRALKEGIPIGAIKEEVDSAYRAYVFTQVFPNRVN